MAAKILMKKFGADHFIRLVNNVRPVITSEILKSQFHHAASDNNNCRASGFGKPVNILLENPRFYSAQLSTLPSVIEFVKIMKAWQVNSYDGPRAMKLNEVAPVPPIGKHEVLIKVKASSVNPLDVLMTKGYGKEIFQVFRHLERGEWSYDIDFPYIPGRDFSGVVEQAGISVKNVREGDKVYGVVLFGHCGTHAEYTKTSANLVLKKPCHLTFTEAASFPFVGLTCWSALKLSGLILNFTGKKILILGGSGGVGTFAVQYCLAKGAEAFTSCETEAIELIESLGVPRSHIADYTDPESSAEIMKSFAPYDCLFDCSGVQPAVDAAMPLLKPFVGEYISLNPPALTNVDKLGIGLGSLKTAADFIKINIHSLAKDKVTTRWGYFIPSSTGLRAIGEMIEKDLIKPVVGVTYPFERMQDAYERVEKGRVIGKVVVEH